MFGMRVRALDAAAHDIWTDYIATHPVEIDDRYGLREMGFRAHAYAEFARTGQIGRLERIEEHLWSYAPAVAEIRRTALRIRPKAAEPVEDLVQARVSAQLKKSGRLSANQTAALLTAAELEEAAQGGKSRGIVMVVSRYTALAALQTITVLRQLHGCLLPIEIYYHTEDELPDGLVDMFKTLGRVSAFNIDTLPYFNSDLEDDAGRYPGLKVTWGAPVAGSAGIVVPGDPHCGSRGGLPAESIAAVLASYLRKYRNALLPGQSEAGGSRIAVPRLVPQASDRPRLAIAAACGECILLARHRCAHGHGRGGARQVETRSAVGAADERMDAQEDGARALLGLVRRHDARGALAGV
ncbi:hypothetical protein L1887_51360 [Cichorium endivia]|nr:hypothetical protein L1887_51360 [Cichorium endivia]